MTSKISYLGDGLYAEFVVESTTLWLKANDPNEPTDKVALEPEVLDALLNFLGESDKYDKIAAERDAARAGWKDELESHKVTNALAARLAGERDRLSAEVERLTAGISEVESGLEDISYSLNNGTIDGYARKLAALRGPARGSR